MIRYGRVRWFNKHFGYGFIAAEDGQDVFVHNSVIPPDEKGWRGLQRGVKVEYMREATDEGLRVTELTVL